MQTSIHFNWPMIGQFDIIFLDKAPSILCKFRIKRSSHHLELRLHSPENTATLFLHEVLSLAPYLGPFQCYDSRSLVVFVFVCLQGSTLSTSLESYSVPIWAHVLATLVFFFTTNLQLVLASIQYAVWYIWFYYCFIQIFPVCLSDRN